MRGLGGWGCGCGCGGRAGQGIGWVGWEWRESGAVPSGQKRAYSARVSAFPTVLLSAGVGGMPGGSGRPKFNFGEHVFGSAGNDKNLKRREAPVRFGSVRFQTVSTPS